MVIIDGLHNNKISTHSTGGTRLAALLPVGNACNFAAIYQDFFLECLAGLPFPLPGGNRILYPIPANIGE